MSIMSYDQEYYDDEYEYQDAVYYDEVEDYRIELYISDTEDALGG